MLEVLHGQQELDQAILKVLKHLNHQQWLCQVFGVSETNPGNALHFPTGFPHRNPTQRVT